MNEMERKNKELLEEIEKLKSDKSNLENKIADLENNLKSSTDKEGEIKQIVENKDKEIENLKSNIADLEQKNKEFSPELPEPTYMGSLNDLKSLL